MGSALIYLLLRDKYVGSTFADHKLDIAQAFGMETLGTFVYVFAYFAALDRNRKEGPSGGSPSLLFMAFFTAAVFTVRSYICLAHNALVGLQIVKSYPYEMRGGGARKVLAMLKGGHTKFWGSFYVVAN